MRSEFDYRVLVNDRGQYSLWPESKPVPTGWRPTGAAGTREEVLEWIETHWKGPGCR